MTRQEWYNTYSLNARLASLGTPVPASVILAISFQESNKPDGISYLAKQANNFGGVKYSTRYHIEYITLPTKEVLNGKTVTIRAKFAKFANIQAGFNDIARVATRAYNQPTGQLSKLASYYATDPNYFKSIASSKAIFGKLFKSQNFFLAGLGLTGIAVALFANS